MNILIDASLPGINTAFSKEFKLTQYHHPDDISELIMDKDVLICRATLKVNQELLTQHKLKYVATASSGTDHLDPVFLKSQNIQIIDAKGCNATSVADYVVATLASLNKKQLVKGKCAGIIGMGHVGSKVFERLKAAGFHVNTYDPLKADFKSCTLEEIYNCDLICIHAELHHNLSYPSHNLINQQFLARLKDHCVIINAARGGIVNEEALLQSSKPLTYCTDVYLNEPHINPLIIKKATLCTPHIAGHSIEAKRKALTLVSEQLHKIAGIPFPQCIHPLVAESMALGNHASWEDQVLSIYNPETETLTLKEHEDFLTLRVKHLNRHDFKEYGYSGGDRLTELILGL